MWSVLFVLWRPPPAPLVGFTPSGTRVGFGVCSFGLVTILCSSGWWAYYKCSTAAAGSGKNEMRWTVDHSTKRIPRSRKNSFSFCYCIHSDDRRLDYGPEEEEEINLLEVNAIKLYYGPASGVIPDSDSLPTKSSGNKNCVLGVDGDWLC